MTSTEKKILMLYSRKCACSTTVELILKHNCTIIPHVTTVYLNLTISI